MSQSDDHRESWWPSPASDRAKVARLDLPDGFETVGGARLDEIQVAYESWGELSRDRFLQVVNRYRPHLEASIYAKPNADELVRAAMQEIG